MATTAASVVLSPVAGCGPCRASYVEYEKIVPLETNAAPIPDTLDERCKALCEDTSNDRLETCDDIDVDGQDALSCIYSIYQDCGGIGRVPAGLVAARFDGGANSAMGRYFTQVTYLEAASVYAFRRLERELRGFGAPEALLQGAAAAAVDEARHTRIMARLARRFGMSPKKPRLKRQQARSLSTVVAENAVEGCVRETFGAAVAKWQAVHAADEQVRVAMRTIATDETRHAQLAFAVHGWAVGRLDAATVTQIEEQARTVARRQGRVRREPHPETARVAGFPSVAAQRELARQIGRQLWGFAT